MSADGQAIGMAVIADAAGVSVSTVSRALSGAPGVSAEKRREIVELAKAMGYLAGDRPPQPPRRTGTPRIAAVIPEPDRWVFGSILAGLHDVLTPAGISLTVYQGFSASDRAKVIDSTAQRRNADLVLLVPMTRRALLDELTRIGLPTVVAGAVVPGRASVGIDDVDVGQKATNYLINTGYRRIGFVTSTDHDGTPGNASLRRKQGFLRSLERAGLTPDLQVAMPFGPRGGQDAAQQLLAGDRLPEAFVTSSDEMAAGMMTVFRASGLRIPDDVALIGVDDHPVAELLRLTTIAQPAREQGRVAATMALSILGGTPVAEPVVLGTQLIVRDSTGRPAPA